MDRYTLKEVLKSHARVGEIKLIHYLTVRTAYGHTMPTTTNIDSNANLGGIHDRDSS
jgi:hypothetical protein